MLHVDGPYANFAGRDASRGLAYQSFDVSTLTDVDKRIDDLNDLNDEQKWVNYIKPIICKSNTNAYRHNLTEWT